MALLVEDDALPGDTQTEALVERGRSIAGFALRASTAKRSSFLHTSGRKPPRRPTIRGALEFQA
jgi:hypothetical protein